MSAAAFSKAPWPTKRLKFCATYNDEVLPESTDDFEAIQYVEISDVSLVGGIEKSTPMLFHEAPSRARRRIRGGDILVSTVRTYLKAIAAVNEAPDNLIASTGFCVVRPNDELDAGYAGWVAKSEEFVGEVVSRSVGVSYPAINASQLVDIEVPLPPLETQKRIAALLDEKTAQIDGLIEKKQALLDRLAEKRQAIITQTVTKGLNPAAPMKESGIDWLGQIPKHWEVKRLRFLLDGDTLNGLYKPKDQFHEDGAPFVQMGEAFQSVAFRGGTKDRVLTTPHEIGKWGLRFGDFLIARRSIVFDGSGKSVFIGELPEKHIFESSMIRLRIKDLKFSKYLSYYFQSTTCRAFFLALTKQVTISGVDSQQVKNISVPCPPSDESHEISLFLQTSEENAELVRLSIERSLVQLSEFRSAIITAAVTGQIEGLS